jgi:hypothetical protein
MRRATARVLHVATVVLAISSAAVAQEPQAGEAIAPPAAADQGVATPAPAEASAAAKPIEAAAQTPYVVECGPEDGVNVCYADRGTYVGWRTFHGVCHTCHAQDAVGSTFAPALLPRIREIDKARFVRVLDEGFTGQMGVMPGWSTNPNVNRYYDELWSYLLARADGVLLPGRPKRLPD